MQAGKSAMEATKEAAANTGASARAGMDKTKASVQGKVEKMTAHNAAEKEAVEQRKLERMHAVELEKQNAMRRNAATKERASATHHPSQGAPGVVQDRPAGGGVEPGFVESRPVGTAAGTARPSAAHNPDVGSEYPRARGTGGHYT